MRKIITTSFITLIKKGPILFLKVVILLIAIGALIWMTWFPQLEGRATNLDLISIYKDPLIIYGYIASIPFFVGLYQAFKLLNHIDRNKAFSQSAVNTLRKIKFSALSLIGFIALGVFFLFFFVQGDDIAGPAALGIYIAFTGAVIAAVAAIFQKLLQEGKFRKNKLVKATTSYASASKAKGSRTVLPLGIRI